MNTSQRDKDDALAHLRDVVSHRAILVDYMQKREPVPRELFHYTSSDGFTGIVDSRSIWLTNAAYVNDEHELTYPVRVARSVIQMFLGQAKSERIRNFLGFVSAFVESHSLYKTWFIASFTLDGNSLSQWRGYCRGGGYSLGFDGEQLSRLPDASSYSHGSVIYSQEAQVERLTSVLRLYLHVWEELREEYVDLTDVEYDREVAAMFNLWLSRELIFFKIPAFESENEWRLARRPASTETMLFRSRLGTLTPYLQGRLVASNERLPLEEVFVSPLGDIELAEHAAQSLLVSREYDDVIISAPKYRLRF